MASNPNIVASNEDDDLIEAEKILNSKLSKSNSFSAVKSEPVAVIERAEISSLRNSFLFEHIY